MKPAVQSFFATVVVVFIGAALLISVIKVLEYLTRTFGVERTFAILLGIGLFLGLWPLVHLAFFNERKS